jgi:AraC-like DNA-binding protein
MCTEHGMAIYNGVELRADGFPQGFANKEKVRAILEDSDHELWFVPDRGNLFRSNLQLTEFSSITQQFAINSRAMTFIIEDSEGMLWIGSESGLARYDKKETMSYFNGSNGLPNKVFTLCPPVRDSNGDLWMGNNRGLVKLDFERFRRLPKLKSLPVLTDLECNGHSIFDRVKVGKTSYVVQLTGDENNLAVSYANFDYKDPEDLIVEYYLEGRETEWHVNSGKNQIRYFDLPKGKYRLHLRQGGDSTSETVIDIRIDRKVDVAMVVMVLLLLFTGGFAAYFCYKHLYLSRVMAAQDATLARERQEASDAAEAEKLKRYQTARLSDEECKRLFKKLEAVMKQQRPYTNPDLKSSELAAMIGTTSHGLSFLFNQWLNKNFYDYVNEYRVEAFKRLVMEEGANKYTLTAMSQKCGFSSRASFFRHFKQITGVTPADWIASFSR